MLPDGDGIDLLKELQKIKKNQNVIIISAKDSVEDKVAGLEIGADDYLSKPFHLAELNARIRSVSVNPTTHEAYVDGNKLELNRKEYNILLYFMTRPNHLIDKAVLAEAVWGDHIDQADNFDFIYTQVKNLRKKMNEAGAGIEIKAVYGLGYKLALR